MVDTVRPISSSSRVDINLKYVLERLLLQEYRHRHDDDDNNTNNNENRVGKNEYVSLHTIHLRILEKIAHILNGPHFWNGLTEFFILQQQNNGQSFIKVHRECQLRLYEIYKLNAILFTNEEKSIIESVLSKDYVPKIELTKCAGIMNKKYKFVNRSALEILFASDRQQQKPAKRKYRRGQNQFETKNDEEEATTTTTEEQKDDKIEEGKKTVVDFRKYIENLRYPLTPDESCVHDPMACQVFYVRYFHEQIRDPNRVYKIIDRALTVTNERDDNRRKVLRQEDQDWSEHYLFNISAHLEFIKKKWNENNEQPQQKQRKRQHKETQKKPKDGKKMKLDEEKNERKDVVVEPEEEEGEENGDENVDLVSEQQQQQQQENEEEEMNDNDSDYESDT